MIRLRIPASRALQALRLQIDLADNLLLMALAIRNKAAAKVGDVKAAYGLPLLQKDRWERLRRDRLSRARRLGLSERFVSSLLDLLHAESQRIQRERGGAAPRKKARRKPVAKKTQRKKRR